MHMQFFFKARPMLTEWVCCYISSETSFSSCESWNHVPCSTCCSSFVDRVPSLCPAEHEVLIISSKTILYLLQELQETIWWSTWILPFHCWNVKPIWISPKGRVERDFYFILLAILHRALFRAVMGKHSQHPWCGRSKDTMLPLLSRHMGMRGVLWVHYYISSVPYMVRNGFEANEPMDTVTCDTQTWSKE